MPEKKNILGRSTATDDDVWSQYGKTSDISVGNKENLVTKLPVTEDKQNILIFIFLEDRKRITYAFS
jgi:hypothetical protein